MAMSTRDVVILVVLLVGVVTVLLSSVALFSRDVFDSLHFIGPATVLAPWLAAIAVVVKFSSTESVIKSILLALAFLLGSPVLTHATAKTAHCWNEERPHPRKKD
jgi:monovalent cation/proton antiporter MnhG/PhaG subunit